MYHAGYRVRSNFHGTNFSRIPENAILFLQLPKLFAKHEFSVAPHIDN